MLVAVGVTEWVYAVAFRRKGFQVRQSKFEENQSLDLQAIQHAPIHMLTHTHTHTNTHTNTNTHLL